MTYHPDVILASDDGHKKGFPDVPMTCCHLRENMKIHALSKVNTLDEINKINKENVTEKLVTEKWQLIG